MRTMNIIIWVILPVVLIILSFTTAAGASQSFDDQRRQMVARQLRARNIDNPAVLTAMSVVPRHLFVPLEIRDRAYDDTPLPIGYGQTISQPYIVALMSQLLGVEPDDRVLEVGTGSGYQAAILAEMGVKVFTIEIVRQLGLRAKDLLNKLEYDNVQVKIGDGYLGWSENAPFDGIIVTCAPKDIPEPLKNQLAEGGRMVIPVGGSGFQQLLLLTKKGGRVIQRKIIDVRFVPMVDEKGNVY